MSQPCIYYQNHVFITNAMSLYKEQILYGCHLCNNTLCKLNSLESLSFICQDLSVCSNMLFSSVNWQCIHVMKIPLHTFSYNVFAIFSLTCVWNLCVKVARCTFQWSFMWQQVIGYYKGCHMLSIVKYHLSNSKSHYLKSDYLQVATVRSVN